jgi:ketosteroid isomerase-like protein
MNKKILAAMCTFALTLAACGDKGTEPNNGNWEYEVRDYEKRHLDAFLATDVAAIDAMLADDFIVNSPQNRIIGKQELLGMVESGVLAISTFEQDIQSMRRYGNIAVVMGEDLVVYAHPSPAAGRTDRRRFTDLWELRDDTWIFIARQASIINP